jgi:DNA-binding transcriptional MerR regulator
MKTYSSKEIQELAGVSKIQLIHWIDIGAIVPWKEDRRRGGKRLFNQQNLIEVLICRELNNFRLPGYLFKVVLDDLRTSDQGISWKKIRTERAKNPFLLIAPWNAFKEVNGQLQEVKESGYLIRCEPQDKITDFLKPARSCVLLNLNLLIDEAEGL